MTNKIIQSLIEKLALSPEDYKKAENMAADLASHLERDDNLRQKSPQLFIQGSFRLGTVVKPVEKGEKFDIDIVCVLTSDAKPDITKQELYEEIGRVLEKHPILGKKFKPKPRCWAADIDDQFKIDIVPAILDPESSNEGILIQDKNAHRWQKTNPKAFFKRFDKKRQDISMIKNDTREGVDMDNLENERKLPLQVAVQILKRMRDIHFKGNKDYAPSSILLTAIATNNYNGESDVASALNAIINGIPTYKEGDINVSFGDENFADRLNGEENQGHRQAFVDFIQEIKILWDKIAQVEYWEDLNVAISLGFGHEVANSMLKEDNFGLKKRRVQSSPVKIELLDENLRAKPWKSH